MAADFGLLSSAGQIPLKVDTQPNIDVVGNQTRAFNLADTKVKTESDIESKQRSDSDRKVIQEAMQTGKYDLSHPDGTDALLKDTQGKLSPDTATHLAATAAKQREQYAQYQEHVANAGADKIKFMHAAEEEEMPLVGQLLDHVDKVREAKGEQEAQRAYQEGRTHLAADMKGKNYPPEVIAKLTESDPDTLRSIHQGSDMRKRILAEQLQTEDIALKKAKEEAIRNPQDWQQYVGGDGAQYKWNKKAGVTQVYDKTTGTWGISEGGLPPDAKPLTGLGSGGKAQSPLGRLMADYDAAKASGKMTPEKEAEFKKGIEKATGVPGGDVGDLSTDEREALVKFQAAGGKVPIPAYGSGTGTASVGLKKQFVKDFIGLMLKDGLPPDEAATTQLAQKAEQASIQKLVTQDNSLKVVENVAKQDIENIKGELKKLGGADSPLIRKSWNKTMTEVVGDPQYSALVPYFTALQDHASRILSQSTGAGAPAVAYVNLAKGLSDPNQNLGQFITSSAAFTKQMDQRVSETEKTIKDAQKTKLNFGSHLDKPGSGSDVQDPKDQAARDKDAVTLLKQEYGKILDRLSKATAPEDRKRILNEAREARKELKNNKVDVPEPGEPLPADKPKAKVTVSNW
jgi:hypothetical protein